MEKRKNVGSIEKKIFLISLNTYSDGASHRIRKVPSSDASVNKYKNRRSNTKATKPQSASSCMRERARRKKKQNKSVGVK